MRQRNHVCVEVCKKRVWNTVNINHHGNTRQIIYVKNKIWKTERQVIIWITSIKLPEQKWASVFKATETMHLAVAEALCRLQGSSVAEQAGSGQIDGRLLAAWCQNKALRSAKKAGAGSPLLMQRAGVGTWPRLSWMPSRQWAKVFRSLWNFYLCEL